MIAVKTTFSLGNWLKDSRKRSPSPSLLNPSLWPLKGEGLPALV